MLNVPGNFFGFLNGTNFAPIASAIGGPNIKPLASIPEINQPFFLKKKLLLKHAKKKNNFIVTKNEVVLYFYNNYYAMKTQSIYKFNTYDIILLGLVQGQNGHFEKSDWRQWERVSLVQGQNGHFSIF